MIEKVSNGLGVHSYLSPFIVAFVTLHCDNTLTFLFIVSVACTLRHVNKRLCYMLCYVMLSYIVSFDFFEELYKRNRVGGLSDLFILGWQRLGEFSKAYRGNLCMIYSHTCIFDCQLDDQCEGFQLVSNGTCPLCFHFTPST